MSQREFERVREVTSSLTRQKDVGTTGPSTLKSFWCLFTIMLTLFLHQGWIQRASSYCWWSSKSSFEKSFDIWKEYTVWKQQSSLMLIRKRHSPSEQFHYSVKFNSVLFFKHLEFFRQWNFMKLLRFSISWSRKTEWFLGLLASKTLETNRINIIFMRNIVHIMWKIDFLKIWFQSLRWNCG